MIAICMMCGAPADLRFEQKLVPLSAKGVIIANHAGTSVYFCAECISTHGKELIAKRDEYRKSKEVRN